MVDQTKGEARQSLCAMGVCRFDAKNGTDILRRSQTQQPDMRQPKGRAMNKPTEYRIEHVRDLLAIPEDRLDACFADMRAWVTLMQVILPEVESMIRSAGIVTTQPVCNGFVWVDDGKPGCSGIRLEIKQETEPCNE
jgi:hypothetical protein